MRLALNSLNSLKKDWEILLHAGQSKRAAGALVALEPLPVCLPGIHPARISGSSKVPVSLYKMGPDGVTLSPVRRRSDPIHFTSSSAHPIGWLHIARWNWTFTGTRMRISFNQMISARRAFALGLFTLGWTPPCLSGIAGNRIRKPRSSISWKATRGRC
jgi:hypothetical protein